MTDRFEGNPSELAAYKAGQIDAKLAQLAEHAKSVNGSIEDSGRALAELTQAVLVLDTRVKLTGRLAVFAVALIVPVIAIANFLTAH